LSSPAEACRYQGSHYLGVFSRPPLACAHPLCGTVFAPHAKPLAAYPNDGSSCSPGDYRTLDAMRPMHELEQRGGILLLGETHDNAEHHRFRARVVTQSIQRQFPGSPRAVVFEHIRADQQAALDDFAAAMRNGPTGAGADGAMDVLDWDKSGWPARGIFRPLFEAALAARLPILAGDPPRERVRAVAKDGLAALGPPEVDGLGLAAPLDAGLNEALLGELEASHCGLMPRSAFGNMAHAQRYRDAHLAAELARAYKQHGTTILFAGNGHLRSDRGVPHYLRRLLPGVPIVSIMLVEVEAGKTDPQAYIPRGPDGASAVDYIVFTPHAEREDPCKRMRERFGKRG
jgi:uncharacterized iron-regulated protein